MENNNYLIPIGAAVAVAAAAILYFVATKSSKSGRAKFLNDTQTRKKVTLIDKTEISHDTRRFRFALPNKEMVLGLPVGKHFTLYAPNAKGVVEGEWNGKKDNETRDEIERKYTPTSSDDDIGYFDLVIKVYKPNERFSDGGKMSQYLDTLVPGKSEIEMRGPFGMIEYKGNGIFEYMKKPLPHKNNVGMMAGGTGITPMLQIITAILKNPSDATKISLVFANQTESDILVREELESLAQAHPSRFKLWFTLDRPGAGWKYGSGFINEEMIQKHLPGPAEDTVILMCGPPPMVQFACQANLAKLGYPKEQQLVF